MIARLSYIALFLLLPFITTAHGYWIELQGTHKINEPVTIQLYYGEYSLGERMSGKYLDKMKDIKVYVQLADGKKTQITMQQTDSFWAGSFTPTSNGTYVITGINDVRDVQDWTKHNLGITRPVQYLKAYYTVQKHKQNKSQLPLDLSVKNRSKGKFELTVLKNGEPIPEQKLLIASSDDGAEEYTTDTKGKLVVTLKNIGLYIISIDWIDQTPGSFNDKQYETVRHRLDYSLYY